MEDGAAIGTGIYYWSVVEGKWVLSKNVTVLYSDETLNPLGYFSSVKIDEIQKKKALQTQAIQDAQIRIGKEMASYEYAKSQNIFYIIYQLSPLSPAAQATINFSNGEYGWGIFNAAITLLGAAEISSMMKASTKSIGSSLDEIWKQTDFNRNVLFKNSLARTLYSSAGDIAEARMGLLPVVDVLESGTGVAFRAVDDFAVYENGLKKTISDLSKAKQVGSVAGISGEVKLSGVRLDIAVPRGKGIILPENISSYAKTNGITVKVFEVAEEGGEIVAKFAGAVGKFSITKLDDYLKVISTRNPAGAVGSAPRVYQEGVAGALEYELKGGANAKIWADGLDKTTGTVIEAKYISNPSASPFVEGSSCYPPVRQKILEEVTDEFRRYAEIIKDPNTPLVQLEVFVSDAKGVPYFQKLLNDFSIPGKVIVKP